MSLPADLRDYTTVLAQCGPIEDVLCGAVRAGIFLTRDQLESLYAEYNFPMPPAGAGHGTNGGIVKRDYAEGLVKFLMGREATDDMVDALMGRATKTLGRPHRQTANVLAAFRALDPQDQPDFQKLADVARDEELLAEARQARADTALPHGSAKHETPKVLRNFLPRGPDFACKLNRHPVLKRYQVYIMNISTRDSDAYASAVADRVGLSTSGSSTLQLQCPRLSC